MLGPSFDVLLGVMLDLGVPPIFVHGDARPRLASALSEAVALLDAWEQQAPGTLAGLAARIPEVLRVEPASQGLIEAATWSAYFDLPDRVLGPPSLDGRVVQAVPELRSWIDDDGLVDVSQLDARPHGLVVAGYSLHYHQLLRRGFVSNIHYELVGLVLGLAHQHGLRARLAVDDRRLRRADEHEEIEERDYWFGPPLVEDALDDVFAVGETFHGDPDGGRSFIHPYAGLSVRWTSDGTLKTVEIEEFLPTSPTPGSRWVLGRYLHAIRDTREHAFVHCDGAVKAYNPLHYPAVQSEFAARGKSDRYQKVFRVDGTFPADAWAQLAAAWFRGNRLILEYLGSGT